MNIWGEMEEGGKRKGKNDLIVSYSPRVIYLDVNPFGFHLSCLRPWEGVDGKEREGTKEDGQEIVSTCFFS